jgi:hypothetical protein
MPRWVVLVFATRACGPAAPPFTMVSRGDPGELVRAL